MRFILSIFAVVAATQVSADCAAGQEIFMSCSFQDGRKSVEVCVSSKIATYAFGPTGGTPELALSVPVSDIDYTPWPGAGSSIWEEIAFVNNGVVYNVSVGRTRPVSNENEPIERFGGIDVMEDGQVLASLTCDAGSVVFPWTDVLGG